MDESFDCFDGPDTDLDESLESHHRKNFTTMSVQSTMDEHSTTKIGSSDNSPVISTPKRNGTKTPVSSIRKVSPILCLGIPSTQRRLMAGYIQPRGGVQRMVSRMDDERSRRVEEVFPKSSFGW